MSTNYDCPDCGNKDILCDCIHSGKACRECETDPNAVMVEGNCFFCMCEGKPVQMDFRAKDMFNTALHVAQLGQKRRALGLPPPIFSEKAVWYVQPLHELYMIGFGKN